jgi:hypothetical protein
VYCAVAANSHIKTWHISNAGIIDVTAPNAVCHCSVCKGVRVTSVEQGKPFVTAASEQHAGNECRRFADAVNTRCVKSWSVGCGHTVWPFSHIRVVPAIVNYVVFI